MEAVPRSSGRRDRTPGFPSRVDEDTQGQGQERAAYGVTTMAPRLLQNSGAVQQLGRYRMTCLRTSASSPTSWVPAKSLLRDAWRGLGTSLVATGKTKRGPFLYRV